MKKQKNEHKPIKLEKIKTYSIKKRKNLVKIDQFGKAIQHGAGHRKKTDYSRQTLGCGEVPTPGPA